MKTSDDRGANTRNQILQTALESFSGQGYEATGVAEICRRAGVSKGAFYYHFASKQALFLELLNRWLDGLNDQLSEMQDAGRDVPDALRRMSSAVGHVARDARGQVAIFLEFWNQAAHDAEVWRATIAPYRTYRDLFAEIVERGIAEGSLRPCDPVVAAQAIVSLGVGLLLQATLDTEGADWERVAEQSVSLFLSGLEAGV